MTPTSVLEAAPGPAPGATRIASVDALRGLVITLMIFVNDLGETPQAPAWLKHVGAARDAMHIPDLVFPAFLFIAGVSIPIAFERALSLGRTRAQLLGKALARTASLLVIGVVMVNMEKFEPWPNGLWGALAYVAMFLTFAVVPAEAGRGRTLLRAGRAIGAAALAALVLAYRTAEGKALVLGPLFDRTDGVWLRHWWWGILGLIAWAYLAVAVVYLIAGRRREWLFGATGWFLLLYAAARTDLPAQLASRPWLGWATPALAAVEAVFSWVNGHVDISTSGSLASITMAGCCLGSVLAGGSRIERPAERLRWALAFSAGLILLGVLVDAPFGINKNRATPSWCMYCSGITCAVWAFLSWLMDVRGRCAWSRIFQPAGANPLLAYMLHPFLYLAVGLAGEKALSVVFFHHSLPPAATVLGSFVMALIVVQATGWIARLGYRLKV
jgi:predicted acyltransferase